MLLQSQCRLCTLLCHQSRLAKFFQGAGTHPDYALCLFPVVDRHWGYFNQLAELLLRQPQFCPYLANGGSIARAAEFTSIHIVRIGFGFWNLNRQSRQFLAEFLGDTAKLDMLSLYGSNFFSEGGKGLVGALGDSLGDGFFDFFVEVHGANGSTGWLEKQGVGCILGWHFLCKTAKIWGGRITKSLRRIESVLTGVSIDVIVKMLKRMWRKQ